MLMMFSGIQNGFLIEINKPNSLFPCWPSIELTFIKLLLLSYTQ